MSEPAISVQNVSKRYRLGTGHTDVLAERLQRLAAAPFRALRSGSREETSHLTPEDATDNDLWALRDVSLEIDRGEAVALIGRNGSGKSTLLKLLSRITLPTEGRIVVRGRAATLLEVGTGFHPELSGRENIFINGAILGMRRREIEAKFDEIVDFSGIERFIDTPVKRYSSGMYVRLAFAVAAHLEPEILLVDEVLAVGDVEFQRKCLGKMQEVSEHGRTVVFVSHNLSAVQRLCSRVYVIDKGRLVMKGSPAEAVAVYLDSGGVTQNAGVAIIGDDVERFKGSDIARLRRVAMTDVNGVPTTSVRIGQRFRVTLTYEAFEAIDEAVVELGLCSTDGQRIATLQNTDHGGPAVRLAPGFNEITVEVAVALLPGEFVLEAALHKPTGVSSELVYRALRFTALNIPQGEHTSYPWPVVRGYVRPDGTWTEARTVSAETSVFAHG